MGNDLKLLGAQGFEKFSMNPHFQKVSSATIQSNSEETEKDQTIE
jgi:hypothetical protein